MHNNNRWPTEPPATGYTRSTSGRRRLRPHWPSIISAAAVLGIAATAVLIVLSDSPARGAADHAAVISPPSSVPGPPVSRADLIPGDGTWLVGTTAGRVKPGLYRSAGGKLCYWERLAGLSGDYVDLTQNGGFRDGPLLVEVLSTDYAFSSQGCYRWERVSDQ